MGFIKEFKEFALKGNLVDTAIAFVMGAAFGKVVTAFVEKCFAPIIGMILGGVDLNKKVITLKEAIPDIKDASGTVTTPGSPAIEIQWGSFITAFIDFLVVAFVMFLIIKTMNKIKKQQETNEETPGPSTTDTLLMEIRDALKK